MSVPNFELINYCKDLLVDHLRENHYKVRMENLEIIERSTNSAKFFLRDDLTTSDVMSCVLGELLKGCDSSIH